MFLHLEKLFYCLQMNIKNFLKILGRYIKIFYIYKTFFEYEQKIFNMNIKNLFVHTKTYYIILYY